MVTPKKHLRTVNGEMDPAAVVECVILLVQHEDFAFVPALVLRAHLLQPQRCFIMKTGPAWRGGVGHREQSPVSHQAKPSALPLPQQKTKGPFITFRPLPMAVSPNGSRHPPWATGTKARANCLDHGPLPLPRWPYTSLQGQLAVSGTDNSPRSLKMHPFFWRSGQKKGMIDADMRRYRKG